MHRSCHEFETRFTKKDTHRLVKESSGERTVTDYMLPTKENLLYGVATLFGESKRDARIA